MLAVPCCNAWRKGFQRGRLSGGHLLENLGGKQQVARFRRRWLV